MRSKKSNVIQIGILAALGLALTGVMKALPEGILPTGCLALAVLTAVLPAGRDK